ncbi:Uncharacterized protein ChrSV_5125 [Chromobacterium vaccinii]|nr:Uncharacterized protein ChrSW_5119 [Chromobacterium vaccinii]QND92580.1 Uncharacterized protein ChrSV_5125 [Chromobacterium vaccinii]
MIRLSTQANPISLKILNWQTLKNINMPFKYQQCSIMQAIAIHFPPWETTSRPLRNLFAKPPEGK